MSCVVVMVGSSAVGCSNGKVEMVRSRLGRVVYCIVKVGLSIESRGSVMVWLSVVKDHEVECWYDHVLYGCVIPYKMLLCKG
jgi:hypothetical protein